jgi:hypothetical protein
MRLLLIAAFVVSCCWLVSVHWTYTRVSKESVPLAQQPLTQPPPRRYCPTVDVVFTWVDGSDPAHSAALNAVLGGTKVNARAFRDYGVMRFAIRSLFRFAPWFARIYVLTNGQVRRPAIPFDAT